ncbi:T9SS type A sorting domain-containing protein [bacterium]|nr:T9SS type A sorting domain-containing protein [bacterium]
MIVLVLLLCLAAGAQSEIIDVWPESDLQSTVNFANSGDTLLLAPGTYSSTVVLREYGLTIASRFITNGDSDLVAQTIWTPMDLDDDTANCLVARGIISDTLFLLGLTFADGLGVLDQSQVMQGGAIYSFQSNLVLRDCHIRSSGASNGGGVYSFGFPDWDPQGSLVVSNCLFDSCSSGGWGGAIYANRNRVQIEGSSFIHNATLLDGGALISLDCSIEINDCLFQHNSGATGGAYIAGKRSTTTGSQFIENSSDDFYNWASHLAVSLGHHEIRGCYFGHSGIPAKSVNTCCDNRDTVIFNGNLLEGNIDDSQIRSGNFSACGIRGEVSNCVFRNNVSGGGQIYVFCGSRIRIFENYINENSSLTPGIPSVIRTATQGVPTIYDNIISGNTGQTIDFLSGYPSTIDARNNWWGHETGPYHPTRNPFGQGDTILSDSVLFDPWLLSPPDTSNSVSPRPEAPVNWKLMNVYPNPFNSELSVAIAGLMGDGFSLKLYDTLGREVATLLHGRGHGQMIHYSAPNTLATGVYFLRAAEEQSIETRKVVFLK